MAAPVLRRPSRVIEVWMAALVLSEPRLVFEPTVAVWNVAMEAESTEFSPLRALRAASVQWHFDANEHDWEPLRGVMVRLNFAYLFARNET